jgi:hypothetical protein
MPSIEAEALDDQEGSDKIMRSDLVVKACWFETRGLTPSKQKRSTITRACGRS